MSNRIKPSSIARRVGSSKLATKKLKEIRVLVYTDQAELMETWCQEQSTTQTNVVKKLINYFLHAREGKRQKILKEY